MPTFREERMLEHGDEAYGVSEEAAGQPQPRSPSPDDGDDGDSPRKGALGVVVSTDRSPTFAHLDVRLERGAKVRPGIFVAVRAESERGSSLVLARVLDVHEVNPHEDPQSSTLRSVLPFDTRYAAEGASTVIYRLASAEPLEEAVLGEDGSVASVRSVETLPRAGAPVIAAGPELTVSALGLEPDPEAGIHVGAVHGQQHIPVTLTRNAPQRHMFIAGGIGSGKSYTRGVIGEELHRWGVPQVNIDVNGEMVKAAAELGGRTLRPDRGGGFTLPLSALTSADVLEAVPSINPTTNMATLLTFAFESLQRELRDGIRDHFGVAELIAEMDNAAMTLGLTAKNTLEPAKLRTSSLSRLPFIGDPFDWRAALVPGAFINIDCRSPSLLDLQLIAASVARDLQRLARRREIPFVVFSIDEFHLVAPNGGDTVASQVLREIARIGRHHRLGLILTTQSPSDVDRSILKRMLTRFLHSIEPDQLDALRGVFSDASQELVRMMPKLPQGTCVLTGVAETVRHATVVEVRERATTHGGETPNIWLDLEKRGWAGKRPMKLHKQPQP